MSSTQTRPLAYYYIRRGYWSQLLSLCDMQPSLKKGSQGPPIKDVTYPFWKAFALGMDPSQNSLSQCLQELESLQSRREMQFPAVCALLFFLRRQSGRQDKEHIQALASEKLIAEDVTKEAGLLLAARFSLFVDDTQEASRLAKKILRGNEPSTPTELDAATLQLWCTLRDEEKHCTQHDTEDVVKVVSRINRGVLQSIEAFARKRESEADLDLLMLWMRANQLSGLQQEAVNILNKVIAIYPWFVPGLTEKAALLAAQGEWESALDTTQRALDAEPDNLDALTIVAVHSFTQESQPHDSLQKLEDLDSAIASKEPNSTELAFSVTSLFSRICSRQPRALQIVQKLIERACRLVADENTKYLCALGHVLLLQGQLDAATRAFQKASKRDHGCVLALQGMIQCQVLEGHFDDAEAQIELFHVMHGGAQVSPEFSFHQASLALKAGTSDAAKKRSHLELLECTKRAYLQKTQAIAAGWVPPLQELALLDPDFLLQLSVGYQTHIEAPLPSFASKSDIGADSSDAETIGSGGGQTMLTIGGAGNASATLAGGLTLMGSTKLGGTGGGGAKAAARSVGAGVAGHVEVPAAVQSGMDLLKRLQKVVPGMIAAYVEMSRFLVSIGLQEDACRNLRRCLSLQSNCVPALVAMAHVELSRSGTAAADRCLEQALAGDFSVRSCTLFRLLTAQVRAQQNRVDIAIPEAEQLVKLHEVKELSASSAITGTSVAPNAFDPLRLTDDDRVAAFVLYSSLLSKTKRLKEAQKVLSEAKVLFAGSKQEVQVLVAASQLAVERGDYDAAVRMLDKIADDSPIFVRAQSIKADILLSYLRDKEGYTRCFQNLVDLDRSSAKFQSMLGEAYLKILNPELAVAAFEASYRLDPTNGKLRARIGRALVATHEYHRAIDFYKAALRDASSSLSSSSSSRGLRASDGSFAALSHDLAKLYIKLDRSEDASEVLDSALKLIEGEDGRRDLHDMRMDVQSLLLLTEIQRAEGKKGNDVADTLRRARDMQKNIMSEARSLMSSQDTVEAERLVLSVLSEQLGAALTAAGDWVQADICLAEALSSNPHNAAAMYSLAELSRLKGDAAKATSLCRKILLADPAHELATTLLSDLLLKSEEQEEAVKPLQTLLGAIPNNYRALAKMITLLRRSGKLDEAPAFISAAERSDKRSGGHAGLRYCKGLYGWYTNDVIKAVSEFNLARKDVDWGPEALQHMIELYLNPDQDGAWEDKEGVGETKLDDVASNNIAVADRLLKELKPISRDKQRYTLLENYYLLATKQKGNVDKAMQSFIGMLEQDPDSLPAVLGMATGFMIEKSQHKAHNLLKRVAKMEQKLSDGEDFEKANLLLAKFYVDKGKPELSEELCKRCLASNKSCSQAWEILGLSMEKDMQYDKAAYSYGMAWQLEFEASATVGFKYAFSLLKVKQPTQAMDVCEKVLEMYPDYPRMRQEILNKAMLMVRAYQ